MNILHQSLGLDKVSGDVNQLPDNDYDGIVSRSRAVYVASKDEVSHVITYQVKSGDKFNKRTKDEWFTLGNNVRLTDGSVPEKGEIDVNAIGSYTPTMSADQMEWYKKRLKDLGFTDEAINAGQVEFKDLVNIPVTFGVKTKNGFNNVSYARKRTATETPATTEAPASLDNDPVADLEEPPF